MRIGLDIMGGDYAPQYPLEGVALAINNLPKSVKLVLIGNNEDIVPFVEKHKFPLDKYEIVHTSQVVEMGESPTKAMTQKPDSSILVGLKMLKAGMIDIFVSAGNTGAVYVGALYTVKAIEGVIRPAIMSLIPKEKGSPGVLLDIGANADCRHDVLFQFGLLGSIYAKAVLGIDNPKVGLLNIGSEPEKGNLVAQAAYPLLAGSDKINFAGNIEGYDLFNDKCDVVVTDGFTGNIVLKTGETIVKIMKDRGLHDEYSEQFDHENHGGSPVLGVNKPVMIAHGVSTPATFAKMITLAQQIVESKLVEKIKQAFEL
ncbi:MAG: phosphate acyltransferase PlsX [Bacteroidetes bacterium]|nr:phosphate acyltransferase PlsX [Bacteroidota bacterium]